MHVITGVHTVYVLYVCYLKKKDNYFCKVYAFAV